jgi:Adenylate and Guanylate cyclase catalytic domain
MFEKTKHKSLKPKPVAPSLRRRKSYSKEKSNCESDPYSSEAFIATSKALSSFVPNTLMRTLISNTANKNVDKLQPYSTNFTGICLLADISDFTRLSGVFCARGKDGLDDLQSATSGYMGSLVDTIYSYGGDVIKFAGDALVCVFKAQENTSLELTCAYALQCAWTLKDISTPELSLHVAISCGDICVGQLGGYENRWEYLISGSCLHQLSKCLNDAPKKEVAITPEFYENILKIRPIHMVLSVERQFSGNYLVESINCKIDLPIIEIESELFAYSEDSTLLSQTACYVPRPVTQALMTGSFNFLPELREVTTVFVKWDGYDHVEHKDLMSLQKFFYACQDILSDSGGFLRQFLIDDKGCVLIALWGVPTATFHDDCRRALGATVRIRCKLLDMKMPCSCGITSGKYASAKCSFSM